MQRIWHRLTGIHPSPVRQAIGGYRCECGEPLADLGEAGLLDGGHVPPQRRVYERKHGSITRTDQFEPCARRGW
jgi:hypothetical protein